LRERTLLVPLFLLRNDRSGLSREGPCMTEEIEGSY
jgi:hypothetical protein